MTNNSSNRAAVPEAKEALNKFKYEVANELGVPLTDGYNGDPMQIASSNLHVFPGSLHEIYGSDF